MSGKGDARRPSAISPTQYATNFSKTFPPQPPKDAPTPR